MATSDLYASVLSSLTAARSVMLSPAWQAQLDQSTADVRVSAGNVLMHIQGAILALSNASLADIADEMQSNDLDLRTCVNGLTEALKDITNVQSVLGDVAKFLGVVAKVVPLL